MIWIDWSRNRCDMAYYSADDVICLMTSVISNTSQRPKMTYYDALGYYFANWNGLELIVSEEKLAMPWYRKDYIQRSKMFAAFLSTEYESFQHLPRACCFWQNLCKLQTSHENARPLYPVDESLNSGQNQTKPGLSKTTTFQLSLVPYPWISVDNIR